MNKALKSEKLNPLHSLLKSSFIYSCVQSFLTKKGTPEFIYKSFAAIEENEKILDLGCGPAKMRKFIIAKEFVGMDFNESHIQEAKKHHPRDTFLCDDIVRHKFDPTMKFDKILMIGVLHHLNDTEVVQVLSSCYNILKNDGKIFTVDPLFESEQNPIAKTLAKWDQGNFVRRKEQYIDLAKPLYKNVTTEVKRDLLRLPYSHFLMTCS